MREKTVKRLLVLLLAAVLCMGMIGGCNNDGKGTTDPTQSPAGNGQESTQPAATDDQDAQTSGNGAVDMSNVNEFGTFPILKEKVDLSVLMTQDTNIIDMDTNALTLLLEEKVNVDLEFVFLPAADAVQKRSVMFASGETLPDIYIGNMTPEQVYTYGVQEVILPLNDLLENTNYMKNYFATEAGQEARKYIYSPDGNVYGFIRVANDLGDDWDHRHWINKTWLDKLGLDMPTTTDEYYQVLKAFKEQDPNGNGKADEIPLVGNTQGWNQNVWKPLMYSFTYLNDLFNYLQVREDDTLQLSYMQPEFRDGLEYMNMLVNEGLLSPLTFTQQTEQFKQLLENADDQIIGSITAGSMSVYQIDSERKKDMTHIPPLTGPNGVRYTSFRNTVIPNFFGYLTKDCKDPVAATMLIDYMWDDEPSYQARFGVKDVDWKVPDAGAVSVFSNMGYEPKVQYINEIWGSLQNQHWGGGHPRVHSYEMICGIVWDGNPSNVMYMTAQAVEDYKGNVPEKMVQRLMYTDEETEEISEILATLNSYVDESVAAFITGTRPLSDWDNFLMELENIGAQRFIDVSNQAYERLMAN